MFKHTPLMTQSARGWASQRGSALIIALVFLLAMTLIGVTAMQGTTQQESMAGNMRDRNLAFQAAEAALRGGEEWLNASIIADNGTAVDAHVAMPSPSTWDGSSPAPTGTRDLPDEAQLDTDPVFYVDPPAFRRYGIELPAQCQRIYPVMSHGTGGTNTATVLLRSTFDPPQGGLVDCPN